MEFTFRIDHLLFSDDLSMEKVRVTRRRKKNGDDSDWMPFGFAVPKGLVNTNKRAAAPDADSADTGTDPENLPDAALAKDKQSSGNCSGCSQSGDSDSAASAPPRPRRQPTKTKAEAKPKPKPEAQGPRLGIRGHDKAVSGNSECFVCKLNSTFQQVGGGFPTARL